MQRLWQLLADQVPVAQIWGGQAAVSVQRNGAHASIQSRDVYKRQPHRHADELRHQLVLNMTRSDVQAYILDCLDRLLTDHNIRYIK